MMSSDSAKSESASGPFRIKISGDNACFTRPEMKVERVSYDVITPSAARGILEAIMWKPAIVWRISQIDVLKPIRWESVRRNELGGVIPARNVTTAMNTGKGNLEQVIESDRQQRAGLFLRDVSYVVHAHFEMTSKAGAEDNVTKFEQMFLRRAEKGQCFHRPYLGCREFAADFELIPKSDDGPSSIQQDTDLGWMLYDIDFSEKEPMPRFFRAEMKLGQISLPTWKAVMSA